MSVDLIAVVNASHDPAIYQEVVAAIGSQTDLALILVSENAAALEAALPAVAAKKPLIHAATADNYEKVIALAKQYGCPVVVKGNNLADTAELVEKSGSSLQRIGN